MVEKPTRRTFLKSGAAFALTATPIVQALAAEPVAEKIFGYDLAAHAPAAIPGTAFFMAGEVVASAKYSVKDGAGYKDFYAEIDRLHQTVVTDMGDRPVNFYDKDIFMKAVAAQQWVNTHYKYSTASHPSTSKAPMMDGSGKIIGYVDVDSSNTDRVLSPNDVMKLGGKADCIDYAAAKFAALKHMSVPPQDVMYMVGSVHFEEKDLAKKYENAGNYHAWTLVRGPQSKDWIVLETNDGVTLILSEGANIKNLGQFYTPIVGMDGNGRMVFFDSLNKDGTPKASPPSEGKPIKIIMKDEEPATPATKLRAAAPPAPH